MDNKKKKIKDLYDVILSLENEQECADFFADLCTDKEIEKMADRVCAAKLLLAGDTYSEVIKKTDISSATLSRVSRCVQYGKGYNKKLK